MSKKRYYKGIEIKTRKTGWAQRVDEMLKLHVSLEKKNYLGDAKIIADLLNFFGERGYFTKPQMRIFFIICDRLHQHLKIIDKKPIINTGTGRKFTK